MTSPIHDLLYRSTIVSTSVGGGVLARFLFLLFLAVLLLAACDRKPPEFTNSRQFVAACAHSCTPCSEQEGTHWEGFACLEDGEPCVHLCNKGSGMITMALPSRHGCSCGLDRALWTFDERTNALIRYDVSDSGPPEPAEPLPEITLPLTLPPATPPGN